MSAATDRPAAVAVPQVRVGRRAVVKGAGAGLVAAFLAACGAVGGAPTATPLVLTPTTGFLTPTGTPGQGGARPSAGASVAASPAAGGRLLGYAFNAAGRDVTIFDPATRQVVETKPLGATVRWLSNEQRFWDGRAIWTYDDTGGQVKALAIDPRAIAIARSLPVEGRGPAHSLMLTPDLKTAWVNVAGSNILAALDVASGQMVAQVKTGAFP